MIRRKCHVTWQMDKLESNHPRPPPHPLQTRLHLRQWHPGTAGTLTPSRSCWTQPELECINGLSTVFLLVFQAFLNAPVLTTTHLSTSYIKGIAIQLPREVH